jgi:dTDP-4-dehydrorhamnose 3,5-epimerase
MKFTEITLKGAYLVELNPAKDDRGYFTRLFCAEEFSSIGFQDAFVQINQSYNEKKGTFRGLHYQEPPANETKLVRCISGSIFDIILDIRKDSTTFLEWFAIELSEQNMRMLLIPQGFAHGFLTLEEHSRLIYFHSGFYKPGLDKGIFYNDPVLNIRLPFDPVIISQKDKEHPLIDFKFEGIII